MDKQYVANMLFVKRVQEH